MDRRDFMVDKLNSISGLSVDRPQGAFYLFVSCKDLLGKRTQNGKIIANDIDFTEYLLEDHLVCVVPGCAFGIENYFRICYAYSVEQLEIGCQRIADACECLVK